MASADVMALLQQISDRLGRVEAKISSGTVGSRDGEDETSGPKPQVVAFDEIMKNKVVPFTEACSAVDLSAMGNVAKDAFSALRTFIDMASQCYKPAEMSEIQALAKPMIDQIRKAGDHKNQARRTPTEYHWNSFSDALAGSCQWVLTSGIPGVPLPPKAIQEAAIDGATFYINKVRKEHKGESAHDNWVKALLQMLNALRDYAKQHHKAGLVWSFKAQGAKACSEYTGGGSGGGGSSGSAPAESKNPAPPAPVAPKSAAPAANSRSALFAQLSSIDQSSGRTAGLRRVKKGANGKKYVEDDQSNKKSAAKAAKLAKMRGGGGAKKGKQVVAAAKSPVKELRGKKWAIENFGKGQIVKLEEGECNIKQTVYLYNCSGATVQIEGKVNTITVDKCTKTNVIFTNVMGGCELVNCKSVKIQANGACPTVAIDKTDGVVVYAGQACYQTLTIVASKSSEMNVSWPGANEDDAWNEAPIPEQYQHKIVEGKITCDVSDLYSH